MYISSPMFSFFFFFFNDTATTEIYTLSLHDALPIFDERFLSHDDDDAGVREVKAAAVGFGVVADFGVFGKADVAVDDGAANARVPAYVHVIIDDGIRHLAITVHAHVVTNHGCLHASAGDDRTAGHDRIQGHAHALGIGKHEFGGRILLLPGAQRPGFVVQVEDR